MKGPLHDPDGNMGAPWAEAIFLGYSRFSNTFIVYTANIMAILGLRALYFALAAMVHRFQYLKYALALVLVFIGGKIFWNQIFGKVDPAISLGVTLALILGGILYSLFKTRQAEGQAG